MKASVLQQISLLWKIGPVDLDFLHWSILLVCLDQTQLLDNLHATLHPAEDGVLAVQPWCRSECNEELRSICVWTRVGHAEDTSARVLQCRGYLVLELLAVDRCATSSRTGRVTTLDHEIGNYAVEYQPVEIMTLGEAGEILACLWRMVVVELDDNGALLWLVSQHYHYFQYLTIVVSSATSVAMMSLEARRWGTIEDCDGKFVCASDDNARTTRKPQLRHVSTRLY
jgi:hypothetical protein